MFVGNTQAKEILHEFFRALGSGKTVFPFLLLSWRAHVGKTTCVEQEVADFLGQYMSTDYIALPDLHEQLWKDHAIKIEAPRGEEYMTIEEKSYCNRWIREVTHWLSRAPLGQRKVVYLENIERMTTAAANALLKSFEEPLPGRLIIASTTSPDSLLDTIRSRALLVPFHLVDKDELQRALQEHYPQLSSKTQAFVVAFSLWAWGLIEQLLVSTDIDEWVEMYDAITGRCARPTLIHEQMQRLQWVAERWQLEQLLDALLYAGVWNSDLLVRVKKLLQSNVWQDNILFWWCVEQIRGK